MRNESYEALSTKNPSFDDIISQCFSAKLLESEDLKEQGRPHTCWEGGDLSMEEILTDALLASPPPWGLNGGQFPPPPPRPAHLQPSACDLCAWAQAKDYHVIPQIPENGASWILVLVLVSLASATLGAALMVTVMRCKRRIRNNADTAGHSTSAIGAIDDADDPDKSRLPPPAENHYTHMEPLQARQTPISSCDAAYYSELELVNTSSGEGAYEAVGGTWPNCTSDYV